MQGGIKVYRGSAAAARSYVEADRSRADDYYLAEGSGLAKRLVAFSDGVVAPMPAMDGDTYEAWVAGFNVETGKAKGRLRNDGKAVRFLEVVVNGPKTWSLAAAVDPVVAAAYERAQDRAARQILGYLAVHATTRVGPRGRQVQIPVANLEAASVRHYTSRAGDPHWHLHLQVNARVWAADRRWLGLHTVGVRDMLEAINGIGHAAVLCDPEFRATLRDQGYHLDADGEITELAPYAGTFSARAAQLARHLDRYEAKWRAEHPGDEPGPRLRRSWDRRAWAQQRPDKVVPVDGAAVALSWVDELTDQGFTPPTPLPRPHLTNPHQSPRRVADAVDPDEVVDVVLARLAKRHSAWNQADIRGIVERRIAELGVALPPPDRVRLAEALTTRVADACLPLINRDDVPEHIRSLTSPHVLQVEADLTTRLTSRARLPDLLHRKPVDPDQHPDLDPTQLRVVHAITSFNQLVVVEGAAGAGKTTTLAAARHELDAHRRRMVVVTPTLKAAEVAERQVGTGAHSAHWLVHQHGFRWDEDGRWVRDADAVQRGPSQQARVGYGDVLIVDEAGMVDQDLAIALATVADNNGAMLVLMGDRHQLPAVGRGGTLEIAARVSTPDRCLTLDRIHRFADPDYAALTLDMRAGRRSSEIFDQLLARGQIQIHATEVERTAHLARSCADQILEHDGTGLLIADTREQVANLNAAIRDHLLDAGHIDDRDVVTTTGGQRIGAGDRIATRRNDRDLQVANRDTWTVDRTTDDGGLSIRDGHRHRSLPAEYVADHIELAYAGTVHAAQGETVDHADVALNEASTSAAAYVAMTRGRRTNTAHLVAEGIDGAQTQWVAVFSHQQADLGPAAAAEAARAAIDAYGVRLRPPDWTPMHDPARREHERPALDRGVPR